MFEPLKLIRHLGLNRRCLRIVLAFVLPPFFGSYYHFVGALRSSTSSSRSGSTF